MLGIRVQCSSYATSYKQDSKILCNGAFSSVGPCMVVAPLARLVAVTIFDSNTLHTLSQSQHIHQSIRPSAWLTCTRNGARLQKNELLRHLG